MQIGFNCPVYGQVLHKTCRACSVDPTKHRCNYPAHILDKMREEFPDKDRQDMNTPTQLVGCFRQQVIKEEGDYYTYPDDIWAMQRGTIIHRGLEDYEYPKSEYVISESRIYTTLQTKYGEIRFGGMPDRVDCLEIGQVDKLKLVDWKTSWNLDHSPTPPDDHTMQMNMYKFLLESNPKYIPSDLLVFLRSVEVVEMELNYIGSRPKRFNSLYSVPYKGKMIDRINKQYEEIQLQPIKTIPTDVMREWIIQRIEERIEADTKLPGILQGDDAWRCRSCPVKRRCYEIG